MSEPPAPDNEADQNGRDLGKQHLAAAVTVGSLFAFLAFALYLLLNADTGDVGWSRRVYVFASVEAVAFAAVGWLFGREVHRERAEFAEKQADRAEGKAEQQQARATEKTIEAAELRTSGQLLKDEIRSALLAQQARQPPPHLREDFAAASFVAQSRSQLDDLAAKAERLFPEE